VAPQNGWLGEAQGLRTSLEAAKSKLASLKGVLADPLSVTDLGIPTIRGS
jgi:hypothetical protein